MIAEAANLIYALSQENVGNKAVLAAQECCDALFNCMINMSKVTSENELYCYEKIGFALASLMLYPTNHERLLRNQFSVFFKYILSLI